MADFFGAIDLTGGAAGALDAIDGAGLSDKDGAVVITPTAVYHYSLDEDSGAAESSPKIIVPDDNPGDKRWLLRNAVVNDLILTGNITMPDGGTIGQAAGPLLTFYDVDNYLSITGVSRVGIGTVTPDAHLTLGSTLIGAALLTNEFRMGVPGANGNYAILRFGQDAAHHGLHVWYANADPALAYLEIGCMQGNNPIFLQSQEAGNVGIGSHAIFPTAKLSINQAGSSRSIPVLKLAQADISEEFIRFVGTAADNVITQSIVAAADVGTAIVAGYVMVYVQDDGNQITDQAYYVPIYTLAA